MNARGFGFVALDEGGQDVFIPPPDLGTAMHGDRVRISVRPSQRGFEGAVLEVLERHLKRITGVLLRSSGSYFLDPRDAKLGRPFDVQEPLPLGAKPGLVCLAEIVTYPERTDETASVRVIQALGRPGVASVEIEAIKAREGIVEEFPSDVLDEARKIPESVPQSDLAGREDLRAIALTTIDPEDARDHDDAIWAERTGAGGYRVIVAIADVSHYVRVGTAIDREALARGCSVYLPDRAIPMLPAELSSRLASLLPDVDRLTLAIEIELARDGRILSSRVIEGVMRSHAKLSYGEVARALGLTDEPGPSERAKPFLPTLRVLLELAEILRKIRKKRGSLDFDLPEARVKLDPETEEPKDVIRSRADPGIKKAYNLVEEMMLLANEVIAHELGKRDMPAIYRVHGAPNPDRVSSFLEVARALGYVVDEDAAEDPKKLSQLLAKMEGSSEAAPLSTLLLRAMQQATYDVKNIGHFGLAAEEYLHFTSPIRRYPDLAVHRVVRALARKERLDVGKLTETLRVQATESSRLERRAMTTERESVDLYRCILMRERVGEVFDATIIGVAGWGFYAALDAPFVEVLVPSETLGSDIFEPDEHGVRIRGRRSGLTFGLGDRVRVRIDSVSVDERKIRAAVAERPRQEGDTRSGDLPRARRPRLQVSKKSAPHARPTQGSSQPRKKGRSR